jgi:hypothetical protein
MKKIVKMLKCESALLFRDAIEIKNEVIHFKKDALPDNTFVFWFIDSNGITWAANGREAVVAFGIVLNGELVSDVSKLSGIYMQAICD